MDTVDNEYLSNMSVGEQADKIYTMLNDSDITINKGGTVHFGNFRNLGIDDGEIRELLNYLKENDKLIVARTAPGNIKDENDILYDELWTLNTYYEDMPSPFFEQGNGISKFYVSSPKKRIYDTRKAMLEQMDGLHPLTNIVHSVHRDNLTDDIVDSTCPVHTINDLVTNYSKDQITNFLNLNPDDFATSFYDGKPEDNQGYVSDSLRELFSSMS